MVVLLYGAHPAARKPLVETLLEGHAPGEPEAPCVRVCFSPHELLDVPVVARVVLVGAEQAPEWLNIHRPVVWERELVLLLWVEDGALESLRRNAPDFLDWVSHRIEVPLFAPEGAVAELERAQSRVKWIAIAGVELVAEAAAGRRVIEATQLYDSLVGTLEDGDVLVRGLNGENQLWRLMIAHAEVQWHHRVLLVEPGILPPFMWIVDARLENWVQSARHLAERGVAHARLEAALGAHQTQTPRRHFARALELHEAHMELLGRVARARLDHTTVKLARDIGLDDVADGLGRTTWADEEITPERIERGLHGGLRERRALADYVTSTVERAVFDEIRRHPESLRLWRQDIVQDVVEHLYRKGGQTLKSWEPERGSFARFVRTVARRHIRRALRTTHQEMQPASLGEQLEPELHTDFHLLLERAKAFLSEGDRALLDDYFMRGLSASEIAKAWQVNEHSLRSRLNRLLQRLRTLVEGLP